MSAFEICMVYLAGAFVSALLGFRWIGLGLVGGAVVLAVRHLT